jgi:two-component system chemotaxis sensor kinase CheA
MTDSGDLSDDMAQYLQTFLDETEEQLDDLVENMLALERDATSTDDLNEAFRLIHSIKGSAGMMGFDSITMLTHHLENRFERFRSGLAQLDAPTMNLVLRCIDFLRQCNNRLRNREQLDSSVELLDELKRLEEQSVDRIAEQLEPSAETPQTSATQELQSTSAQLGSDHALGESLVRMAVRFQPGLPLTDLKAQLIVSRLSRLGDVKSTQPDLDYLSDEEPFEGFEVCIETAEDLEQLRSAADVDGVQAIEFAGVQPDETSPSAADQAVSASDKSTAEHASLSTATDQQEIPPDQDNDVNLDAPHQVSDTLPDAIASNEPIAKPTPVEQTSVSISQKASPQIAPAEKVTTKVAETMRVDIDRLDNLMNLAGELVVNRARFVQISGQINPALRKASMINRVRDFSDSLRHAIKHMESDEVGERDWSTQVQQLRAGLELMDEQALVWDNGRHCFNQMSEAIDQLSRVSHSLQRGVLDTRMVPVGPLFGRFKRIVRDLSNQRGKKVDLLIRGEHTELDKRMIDELGDPLMHLVRNSLDHGMEHPDVRSGLGKAEVGTIVLEASHSGNNVYVHVRDDGGGIDVQKVKAKLIDKRILSEPEAADLSDQQAIDYIWHPGFSTAAEVTDVSGRGVGMDVVMTRINQLNGTIEVESTPRQGTVFAIRLPLTLAIINSLLVRLQHVTLSMPIDDVREIVSVHERDVVTVHGNQTIDVRDEFIPLVGIQDVFQWHGVDYGHDAAAETKQNNSNCERVDVIILHAGGNAVGLRVDEILGSQDIVIKSLSDNFINIRGLSGASILGDGSVSLMLDVGTVIEMTIRTSRNSESEKAAT